MKKILIILTLQLFALSAFNQSKPAYIIYNAKGRKISYKKMIRTLSDKEIILFGELHNNPISHWLQYEVTSDLNKSRELILGAEMLEADNQKTLNDYLKGAINDKELDSLARL